jgi:hypothetical protein
MRACESTLLPESFPDPHRGNGFHRQGKAKLMCQHAYLSAMMSVMRDHVGEHGDTWRPRPGPSIPPEVLNSARGIYCLPDHFVAKVRALRQGTACLPLRAACAIKLCRKLKVRCGEPQPLAPDVVHVREYCRNGARFAPIGWRPPGPRIQALDNKLVYSVIDGIGFLQRLVKIVYGEITKATHRISSILL